MKKALSQDTEDRFQSANEFLQALNGEIEIEDVDKVQKVKSEDKPENTKQKSERKRI